MARSRRRRRFARNHEALDRNVEADRFSMPFFASRDLQRVKANSLLTSKSGFLSMRFTFPALVAFPFAVPRKRAPPQPR